MNLESLKEGKILVIDKPLDWTSFDVVNKIRLNIKKVFKVKKIKVGHAGTLDPRATGVLVICIGKFTKKINELQFDDKTYTGTIKVGATTESYDTEKPENEFFAVDHINDELIYKTAKEFVGELAQLPPIHSAIKKNGRKHYQLARAGEEVIVEPRNVTIHNFEITNIALPFVQFKVSCSKGTYIRSLAYDFGAALNSGGYLHDLRRTQSGQFGIEEADNSPLEQIFFE